MLRLIFYDECHYAECRGIKQALKTYRFLLIIVTSMTLMFLSIILFAFSVLPPIGFELCEEHCSA
jgi:hypothetical protein